MNQVFDHEMDISKSLPSLPGFQVMPARRRECQSMAWLEDVTGTHVSDSSCSIIYNTLRFVHETKIASTLHAYAILLTAFVVDYSVIFPTFSFISSSNEPNTAMSNPSSLKFASIAVLTSAMQGVITPIRLAPNALRAAAAAVIGLVTWVPGFAVWMSLVTLCSPMTDVPDEQAQAMTFVGCPGSIRDAVVVRLSAILASVQVVISEGQAIRVEQQLTPLKWASVLRQSSQTDELVAGSMRPRRARLPVPLSVSKGR